MDVSLICSFIRDNLENDLSLEAVAKHFGYSRFHLSRQFKQETGYSYKQYVEALKIERSIATMVDAGRDVKSVFIDSRHESSGTFSNTFKKLTGLSPNLYKKSLNALRGLLVHSLQHRGEVIYRSRGVGQGAGAGQGHGLGACIRVSLQYPEVHDERVTFVGLFKNGIPNSAPVVGAALYKRQEVMLDQVPPGTYYLLVTEIDLTANLMQYFVLNLNYRSKVDQPIEVTVDTDLHFNLEMRLSVPEDPPIVINLPFLVKQALQKDRNL